jgi:hypothetical protein
VGGVPVTACTGDWGCMCPRCGTRRHPLDLMARMTTEEKQAIAAAAAALRAIPPRAGCVSCGNPGRLYGNGARWCPTHAPKAPR